MARAKEVQGAMSKLVIASAKEVAMIMASMGIWAAGVSAVNNATKALKDLVALGQLEAGKGFYRWPGCRSEWGSHAQALSYELARILCKYPQSVVRREVLIPHLNRRADALVLIRDRDRAACIWLETTLTETASSISNKRRDIESWNESLQFLSQQFAVEIPSFTFLTSHELNQILED